MILTIIATTKKSSFQIDIYGIQIQFIPIWIKEPYWVSIILHLLLYNYVIHIQAYFFSGDSIYKNYTISWNWLQIFISEEISVLFRKVEIEHF